MKINSYQIGMDSAGTYRSSQTRKYSLSYSKEGGFGSLIESGSYDGAISGEDTEDRMDAGTKSRIKEADSNDSLKSIEQVRERFVLYLWQMFFGKKRSDELAEKLGISPLSDTTGSFGQSASPGFSVIHLDCMQETYFEESEELSFRSTGHVTTADGRSIDFNLDISMSRSFSQYYREEIHDVQAMCDPLVLNFSGEVADLTDQKFIFDLDADGEDDEISMLSSGNGFLALDKNNDGTINDGSELFGVRSGDGFKDLAAYDEDGNGWIDENDSIFDKLKIWVKDAQGNDILYSLKEKNVGAISLYSVDTGFGLRSDTNGDLNGAIRRSGIFLNEDGSGVGVISHLDMSKKPVTPLFQMNKGLSAYA